MKALLRLASSVLALGLFAACGGGGSAGDGGAGGGGRTLFPNAIVSLATNGDQANSASESASFSADGRYVAFASTANNLSPSCTTTFGHVYVRDRQTGSTACVSVNSNGLAGNAGSSRPSISADGRFVAFESSATNLVDVDTNGDPDVFVHDRDADADGIFDEPGATSTVMVSLSSSDAQFASASRDPSISANGRYVAFSTVFGFSGGVPSLVQVQIRDRDVDGDGIYDELGAFSLTRTVSISSTGALGDAISGSPSLSADGRMVAFRSSATNLVNNIDVAGTHDIFIHDRDADEDGIYDQAGGISTTLVSHNLSGATVPTGLNSDTPCMSADGRHIGFTTVYPSVGGDLNGARDVFVYDRMNATTARVSVNSSGAEGDGPSYRCSLSRDGRFAAFSSDATNLVADDANGMEDVFVHDRQTGETKRVTNNSLVVPGSIIIGTSAPAISPDGAYVGFQSRSEDLVAGDMNGIQDVFAFRRP